MARRSMHPSNGLRGRDGPRRTRPAAADRAMTASVLSLRAAVGFDQRARRRAQPRAAHRIVEQAQQRLFELAFRLHLHRRAVARETRRQSPRSSACAGRTRSASRRSPARGCCGRRDRRGCRRRTRRWRADRAAPARRSCRARRRRRAARRRSAAPMRRIVTNPASRARRSTSSNRSGWRGARISSASAASP